MSDFSVQQMKEAIKNVLRQKKIRYEDLAGELECSVPTIKRILGAEELSLSRLIEICEFLGIGLGELETLANKEEGERGEFTPEQQAYLAAHPAHFAYLMKLYAGQSPRKIAEEYRLSARSTDKYLVALEKQGLIRVTGKLKVKPTFKQLPSLGRGPLAKCYYEAFVQNAADFFRERIGEVLASPPEEKGSVPEMFTLQAISISKETYATWMKEQQRRFDELQRLASFEEKTRDSSQLMTAVVLAGGTIVPSDHAGLKRFNETFGKVEAI